MTTAPANLHLGYGFNCQWAFSKNSQERPSPPDERMLDFMAEFGFRFLRIPIDYRFWLAGLDQEPDPAFLDVLDAYVHAGSSRGIHVSLNLHRAPGYVITGWETEATNLWVDAQPQAAFQRLWETAARHFVGKHPDLVSFDLVNEPPDIGQRGFNRDVHQALIRRIHGAIHAIDPTRVVVINGLAGGHLAMPELVDLDAVHSGRGYQPMLVSHFGAEWWEGSRGMPVPTYPCEYDGRWWDRQALWDFYEPWRDVAAGGRPIHIGEFGCYRYTDNDVALRWFRDLFSIYRELGWGYSMWVFDGHFGIANHGRPGTTYEQFHGFNVDRALLDLMLESRADA